MLKGTIFKRDFKPGEMASSAHYNAVTEAAQMVANSFGQGGWMNGAGYGTTQVPVHSQVQAIVTEVLESGEDDGATHVAQVIFRKSQTGDYQDEDESTWEIRIVTTSKPEVEIDVGRAYDFYFDSGLGLWQPLISPLLTYPFELQENFIRFGTTLAKRLIFNVDGSPADNQEDTYITTGEDFLVYDKFIAPGDLPDDDERLNSIDVWNDPPIKEGARGLYQYAGPDIPVIVFLHRPKPLARWIKFQLKQDLEGASPTVTVNMTKFWDGVRPIEKNVKTILVNNELGFASTRGKFGYAVYDNSLLPNPTYRIVQLTCPVIG